LTLAGEVVVNLFAASSAVDTDFTARLCMVDPAGRSMNIQEGIVRARFRESHTEPTPICPGKIYKYEIILGPVGVKIPAGYRIRVDISSSDFPQWDRNLNNGGELGSDGPVAAVVATEVVHHSKEFPSSILLPVMVEGS
jgi:putative CocE/NonD family hydrolase